MNCMGAPRSRRRRDRSASEAGLGLVPPPREASQSMPTQVSAAARYSGSRSAGISSAARSLGAQLDTSAHQRNSREQQRNHSEHAGHDRHDQLVRGTSTSTSHSPSCSTSSSVTVTSLLAPCRSLSCCARRSPQRLSLSAVLGLQGDHSASVTARVLALGRSKRKGRMSEGPAQFDCVELPSACTYCRRLVCGRSLARFGGQASL